MREFRFVKTVIKDIGSGNVFCLYYIYDLKPHFEYGFGEEIFLKMKKSEFRQNNGSSYDLISMDYIEPKNVPNNDLLHILNHSKVELNNNKEKVILQEEEIKYLNSLPEFRKLKLEKLS